MPREPPVTSATRPLSENRSLNMVPPLVCAGCERGGEGSQGRRAFGWCSHSTDSVSSRRRWGPITTERRLAEGGRSGLIPIAIEKSRGRGPGFPRDERGDRGYPAGILRKPFHIAVAAP